MSVSRLRQILTSMMYGRNPVRFEGEPRLAFGVSARFGDRQQDRRWRALLGSLPQGGLSVSETAMKAHIWQRTDNLEVREATGAGAFVDHGNQCLTETVSFPSSERELSFEDTT